jgi:hypothetical protein
MTVEWVALTLRSCVAESSWTENCEKDSGFVNSAQSGHGSTPDHLVVQSRQDVPARDLRHCLC